MAPQINTPQPARIKLKQAGMKFRNLALSPWLIIVNIATKQDKQQPTMGSITKYAMQKSQIFDSPAHPEEKAGYESNIVKKAQITSAHIHIRYHSITSQPHHTCIGSCKPVPPDSRRRVRGSGFSERCAG
jgi:hypothetical protein